MAILACLIRLQIQVQAVVFPLQLPIDVPGKAEQAYGRDADEVSTPCLQSRPDLALVAIWEVDE